MCIVLWLDDERAMPSGYTHWAKTAKEAITLLKTGKVVKISLDHDLGEGNGTGYDVAKWIEEQAHNGTLEKIHCYVHSMNAVGAMNIKMALRSAHKAWMVKDLTEPN